MHTVNSIAQVVRAYRHGARLSQAELARQLGVSRATISRLERKLGVRPLTRQQVLDRLFPRGLNHRVEGRRRRRLPSHPPGPRPRNQL
ncbi:MAG: helix-turn-helix domain-containing protein [Acetobacteraceae bacterium]|nr:helix-turn-helix domain-containing protein [Acetobacteraceae bacterium]